MKAGLQGKQLYEGVNDAIRAGEQANVGKPGSPQVAPAAEPTVIVDPALEPHAGNAANAESKLLKSGEEAIVDAEKSVSKLGKVGKNKGFVVGLILAGAVYAWSGDAYAAGQVLNPLANTTDVATGKDPNGSYVLAGAKDLVGMTPLGLVYGGLSSEVRRLRVAGREGRSRPAGDVGGIGDQQGRTRLDRRAHADVQPVASTAEGDSTKALIAE